MKQRRATKKLPLEEDLGAMVLLEEKYLREPEKVSGKSLVGDQLEAIEFSILQFRENQEWVSGKIAELGETQARVERGLIGLMRALLPPEHELRKYYYRQPE